jgi:hypothetical protein
MFGVRSKHSLVSRWATEWIKNLIMQDTDLCFKDSVFVILQFSTRMLWWVTKTEYSYGMLFSDIHGFSIITHCMACSYFCLVFTEICIDTLYSDVVSDCTLRC